MRKLAVQQPYFLTWLGTYYFILHSDVFIALDDAIFQKRDVYSLWHKNTFDVQLQDRSLTIPIKFCQKEGETLNEIEIRHSFQFKKKHLNTIKDLLCHKPHTKEIFESIVIPLYNENHKFLMDFNMDLIYRVCTYLGIPTDHIKRSSEMGYNRDTGNRIARLESFLDGENCDVLMVDEGKGNLMSPKEDVGAMMELDENFAKYHGEQDWLYHVPIKKFLPKNFNILDILCEHGKETIKFIQH